MKPLRRLDWRTPLEFVPREPRWKARVGLGGLFMLLVPPIGWVVALGYRSLVGNRLVAGQTPLLPSWRDSFFTAFRRGAASSGVILSYLSPFLAAYWLLGIRSADALMAHGREILAFAAMVVILPPLALPTLPIAYALWYDWLHFSRAEIVLLLILFFGGLFVLPAAFLQVALRGAFRAAYNVGDALRLIATMTRQYIEAWIVSLAISAAAVLTGPLAPWMLFWSYLAISHLFLQVLAAYDTEDVRVRFRSADVRLAASSSTPGA